MNAYITMKSFAQYISESSDREYTKFLQDFTAVQFLTDRTTLYIDEIDDLIYEGKPVDKIMAPFKKLDPVVARLEAFAKKDKGGKWQIECDQALTFVEKFNVLKKRYYLRAKNFQDVFNAIKVGQKQDDAIEALVKLGSKLKYYDLEQGRYTIKFFDDINKNDILSQIDHYKGFVKLNGAADFNIQFENGKVKKFYF